MPLLHALPPECRRSGDRYKRPLKRTYQVPLTGVASVYRRIVKNPVYVGVTGSLGKTQLKSLIAAILSGRGRVQYDPGTDNRTYDAAKNLLQLRPSDFACVQEIGLAGPGTMARPVSVFRPDIAVITNVRSDHGSEFRDRHEHVLEKATIIRALPEAGWAILNADESDLEVLKRQTAANVLTFGLAEHADVRGTNISARPSGALVLDVNYAGVVVTIPTQLHGAHNAYAVLAAAAVGVAAGLPLNEFVDAVGTVVPIPGRMEYVEHADGVRFLLDDFKASAGSLVAVAAYLRTFDAGDGRKILILGSITYGSSDPTGDYLQVIDSVAGYCDEVLLVGFTAAEVENDRLPANIGVFASTRDCAEHLLPRLRSGDLVVVKGRNSDDHLRRLEISRRETVNCWLMDCGKKAFCGDCRFVSQPLG